VRLAAIAVLFAIACKKEEKAAPPPTPVPDPQVAIDAAAPALIHADSTDAATPDDAGIADDAPRSKGTSTCQPAECYMPAEKACYVPDPNAGICGKPGAVCRRCKPRT